MSTFCAVDNMALINLIQGANNRIVYIAPGVHEPVAKILKQRSDDMSAIDITVILDPTERLPDRIWRCRGSEATARSCQ